MTPKKKAKELVKKYQNICVTVRGCGDDGNPCIITNKMYSNAATLCSIVMVEEILNLCWNGNKVAKKYWEDVKSELHSKNN
jgi:hypothetical protein